MFLKLDQEYHQAYGIFILAEGNYWIDLNSETLVFQVQEVKTEHLAAVEAAIQKEFGAIERGGNPNHDCTGLPFRRAATITARPMDYDRLLVTFTESDMQYDI